MTLADVATLAGLVVVRDRAFDHLGLFTDRRTNVLAPLFDEDFVPELRESPGVVAVITTHALAPLVPLDRGLAVAGDPLAALLAIHQSIEDRGAYFAPVATSVGRDCRIHPRAHVADQDVYIGDRVTVEPGAAIFERTRIGNDCVVRAGASIGSEGFEPRDVGGARIIVPHTGGVRLGDRVEIHANSVIDRALYGGTTEIQDDTKLDSLVHVSHNVLIGQRCRLAAGAAVGGSTVVGDDVWIGINATISSSLRIGSGARISLGAVVTRDVPGDHQVSGHFAIDHAKWIAFMRTVR